MPQLFTGGTVLEEGVHINGIIGTGIFYGPNPNIPNFPTIASQVPFPAGVIRNLRIMAHAPVELSSDGKLEVTIHSSGKSASSGASDVVARLEGRSFQSGPVQLADSGKSKLGVNAMDLLRIKVANNLHGASLPASILFTYSLEFVAAP